MITVLVLTGVLLLLLSAEAVLSYRWRSPVAVRVHINGTRGKSSVTRYVSAALRAAGYRVLGKITGVVPTILLPDGSHEVIRRRGPARVQEQVRVLRRAAALQCDALVMECMSLNPALQALESRLLKPTHAVLTNILDDHREEFGPFWKDQVEALCAFIPRQSVLVSGEKRFAPEVAVEAARLGTRVVEVAVAGRGDAPVAPGGAHARNVGLALSVCDELGIDRAVALDAIHEEIEKEERLLYDLRDGGVTVRFLNGFAVNDVPSAGAFLEQWRDHLGGWEHMVIVLNTRADRPLRSLQFARWCAGMRGLDRVVVTGNHAQCVRSRLRSSGMVADRVISWSPAQVRVADRSLRELGLADGTLVVGLGNIGGDGFRILESVRTWSLNHCS